MGNLFLFLLQSVFQMSLEIKENKKAAGMKKKRKQSKEKVLIWNFWKMQRYMCFQEKQMCCFRSKAMNHLSLSDEVKLY